MTSKEAEKDGSLTDNTIPELKDLRKGLINSWLAQAEEWLSL